MIKNINLNNEISDRINYKNSKFFYKIPNHSGTKFSLSVFSYIATNVFKYSRSLVISYTTWEIFQLYHIISQAILVVIPLTCKYNLAQSVKNIIFPLYHKI